MNTSNPMARLLGINQVVFALSFARMADSMGNSILLILLPLYVAEVPAHFLNLPESVLVGILISLYGLTFTLFQPIFGVLSDHSSRRKTIILGGLLLMAISTAAFVIAGRYAEVLALRMVQGLAVAMTIPASLTLLANATEKHYRGGSMGVYSTMRLIGLGTGPLVAGFLHVRYGFDLAFYTGSGMVLASAILVQLWVKEEMGSHEPVHPPEFKLFDRRAMDRDILWLMVATTLMASAYTMVNTLENEFNARLQQTAMGFGLAYSALVFGRLLFQVPVGRLSDRIGRKPVIVAGLLLLGLATAVLGYVRTTFEFAGTRTFQGIATAAIGSPILALTADLSEEGSEGRRLSIVNTGFGLGIMIGPLLAGVLATAFFELPFLLGGLLALCSGWIVYRYVPESIQQSDLYDLGPVETT